MKEQIKTAIAMIEADNMSDEMLKNVYSNVYANVPMTVRDEWNLTVRGIVSLQDKTDPTKEQIVKLLKMAIEE